MRIGGATAQPPIASATLDKVSGPVPFTVNIDMSASSDADGTIQYYFFNCGGGTLSQVSITNPAGGTIPRKSTVALRASFTPGTYAISRVDFFVDSSLVCSSATSSDTCNWQVPAKANKTYQIQAKVFDTKGQSGVSGIVSVTAQ